MARITSNTLNDARKMLGAWKSASRQTGAKFDEEFQMREVASFLGVDYVMLSFRLKKKKKNKTPR